MCFDTDLIWRRSPPFDHLLFFFFSRPRTTQEIRRCQFSSLRRCRASSPPLPPFFADLSLRRRRRRGSNIARIGRKSGGEKTPTQNSNSPVFVPYGSHDQKKHSIKYVFCCTGTSISHYVQFLHSPQNLLTKFPPPSSEATPFHLSGKR